VSWRLGVLVRRGRGSEERRLAAAGAGPPAHPHTPIYRDTLRYALAEGGFERLRAVPFPVLVLTAVPPRWLPAPVAALVGMSVYSLERQLRYGRLHPSAGRRLGFLPKTFDLRASASRMR
jgi:hypothetical protein